MARPAAILATAVVLGTIGQLLLYDVGLGVNLPILVTALLVAAWLTADRDRRRLRPIDAWLPFAAVSLAIPVALRGDRTLVVLDILGSLALAAASVALFRGLHLADRPLGRVVVLVGGVLAAAFGGTTRVARDAVRDLPYGSLRRGLGRWAGVLRGLVLAIPLVLIFIALFSAADAVFAHWVERLTGWDLDLGGFVGRTLLGLGIAWLTAGLLAFTVSTPERSPEDALVAAWTKRPRIGSTEAMTVVLTLDLLFAAFVALQGAYLFGGLDTLAISGLTYAEYARRGFFELLAVAALVGGLVLSAETLVRERTAAYRSALIGLVALTLIVLASAFLRLRLYQDAFGWSELRFYVMAAIFWLAVGAVLAVGSILTDRSAWLLHWMLAVSVAFGIAFNVIGPVRYVADRNVDREFAGEELDVGYLVGLGSDAVPSILRSMHGRAIPATVVAHLEDAMAAASGLDDPRNSAWQAWNLAREQARELLGR
jgi:Domain of unknown function (DUF4153)